MIHMGLYEKTELILSIAYSNSAKLSFHAVGSESGNNSIIIFGLKTKVASDIDAPSLANLLMQINAAELSKITSILMKL